MWWINYKTLLSDIKKKLDWWDMFTDRITQYCHVSILPKLISKLNLIPIKVPTEFFMELYKIPQKKKKKKFTWQCKELRNAKPVWRKSNVGLIIKTMWCGVRMEKETNPTKHRNSCCGWATRNPTSIHEDVGSIPGPAQWVKDPVLPWATL